MKINEFARRIPAYYKAGRSIYLRGAIGRGKTTVLEESPVALSKALGGTYGIVVVSGPLLNPTDLVGYLVPREMMHGDKKVMESVFTEPFFYRTRDGRHISDYDGGIILVDESDKMDADCKKIIGEAALSGRLGPHTLPKGWIVWFAGNRAEDRSGSTKEYDHLINRRVEINVDDDIDALLDFMNKKSINPVFKAFAANNPMSVFMPLPEKQGPWCTPRSLVQAAEYVQSLMDDPQSPDIPTDALVKEDVRGMIGDSASSQLWSTIMLGKEMPKLADIIASPKTVKVPQRPDAQMLVCYTLAARANAKNIAPIMTYIERMPAEFTITFGKAAVQRDYELINTPAFGEWTARNATLMVAITDAR